MSIALTVGRPGWLFYLFALAAPMMLVALSGIGGSVALTLLLALVVGVCAARG